MTYNYCRQGQQDKQTDTLHFMQEQPIIEIMLFLSKGVAAPTFSYVHLGSLKILLLLVPVPPLDRISL